MKKFAKGAKKKGGPRKKRLSTAGTLPEFGIGFEATSQDASQQFNQSTSSVSASGGRGMEDICAQVEALEIENQTLKQLVQSHDDVGGIPAEQVARELAASKKEKENLLQELEELREDSAAEINDLQKENKQLREQVRALEMASSAGLPLASDRSEEYRSRIQELEKQLNDAQLELSRKSDEIQQLRRAAAAGQPAGGGGGDDKFVRNQLDDAQTKILSLEEELQDAIQKSILLEVEAANLRMKHMSETPKDGHSLREDSFGSGGDFAAERRMNDMKVDLMQKDQEIAVYKGRLQDCNTEIERLSMKCTSFQKVVNEEEERKAKKKKKGWFGGGGSSKKDKDKKSQKAAATSDKETPKSLSPASGSVRKASVDDIMRKRDSDDISRKSFALSVVQTPAASPNREGEISFSRHLELERENARLDGAMNIVEKERVVLEEKVKRLEAQVEALKSNKPSPGYPSPHLVGVSRTIDIPTGQGGQAAPEADKLKVVVQLQEAALSKISLQNESSKDLLTSYQTAHDGYEERVIVKETKLRAELAEARERYAELNLKKREYEKQVEILNAKLDYCERDNDNLRKSLASAAEHSRNAAVRAREQQDTYALMLSEATKNNESLTLRVGAANKEQIVEVSRMAGEIRGLRDGRAERVEGESPVSLVFPNPINRPIEASPSGDYVNGEAYGESKRHHHGGGTGRRDERRGGDTGKSTKSQLPHDSFGDMEPRRGHSQHQVTSKKFNEPFGFSSEDGRRERSSVDQSRSKKSKGEGLSCREDSRVHKGEARERSAYTENSDSIERKSAAREVESVHNGVVHKKERAKSPRVENGHSDNGMWDDLSDGRSHGKKGKERKEGKKGKEGKEGKKGKEGKEGKEPKKYSRYESDPRMGGGFTQNESPSREVQENPHAMNRKATMPLTSDENASGNDHTEAQRRLDNKARETCLPVHYKWTDTRGYQLTDSDGDKFSKSYSSLIKEPVIRPQVSVMPNGSGRFPDASGLFWPNVAIAKDQEPIPIPKQPGTVGMPECSEEERTFAKETLRQWLAETPGASIKKNEDAQKIDIRTSPLQPRKPLHVQKPDKTPKKPDKTPKKPDKTPKKPDKTQKKPDKTPTKPDKTPEKKAKEPLLLPGITPITNKQQSPGRFGETPQAVIVSSPVAQSPPKKPQPPPQLLDESPPPIPPAAVMTKPQQGVIKGSPKTEITGLELTALNLPVAPAEPKLPLPQSQRTEGSSSARHELSFFGSSDDTGGSLSLTPLSITPSIHPFTKPPPFTKPQVPASPVSPGMVSGRSGEAGFSFPDDMNEDEVFSLTGALRQTSYNTQRQPSGDISESVMKNLQNILTNEKSDDFFERRESFFGPSKTAGEPSNLSPSNDNDLT